MSCLPPGMASSVRSEMLGLVTKAHAERGRQGAPHQVHTVKETVHVEQPTGGKKAQRPHAESGACNSKDIITSKNHDEGIINQAIRPELTVSHGIKPGKRPARAADGTTHQLYGTATVGGPVEERTNQSSSTYPLSSTSTLNICRVSSCIMLNWRPYTPPVSR